MSDPANYGAAALPYDVAVGMPHSAYAVPTRPQPSAPPAVTVEAPPPAPAPAGTFDKAKVVDRATKILSKSTIATTIASTISLWTSHCRRSILNWVDSLHRRSIGVYHHVHIAQCVASRVAQLVAIVVADRLARRSQMN
jgi:hypothetical protein